MTATLRAFRCTACGEYAITLGDLGGDAHVRVADEVGPMDPYMDAVEAALSGPCVCSALVLCGDGRGRWIEVGAEANLGIWRTSREAGAPWEDVLAWRDADGVLHLVSDVLGPSDRFYPVPAQSFRVACDRKEDHRESSESPRQLGGLRDYKTGEFPSVCADCVRTTGRDYP